MWTGLQRQQPRLEQADSSLRLVESSENTHLEMEGWAEADNDNPAAAGEQTDHADLTTPSNGKSHLGLGPHLRSPGVAWNN